MYERSLRNTVLAILALMVVTLIVVIFFPSKEKHTPIEVKTPQTQSTKPDVGGEWEVLQGKG